MTRKRIYLLSAFITIITLMLFVVQILWIESSRESKKRDFYAAVTIALDRAVDAIANEEHYTQLLEQLPEGFTPSSTPNKMEWQTSTKDGVKHTVRSQERLSYSDLDTFSNPYINDSSVIELLKAESKNSSESNNGTPLPKNIIVERIVENIIKIDLPIEQRVTLRQVDTLIQSELRKLDIKAPFEVAIVSEKDFILSNTPEYFSLLNKGSEIFTKRLFPNDYNPVEKYNLKLYFPEQNFYILQGLWVLILISFILSLVILVTFILNVLIITRQKKTSEVRNAFVSNITHELKTPIATISLAAQMLQDNSIPAEAKNVPHLSEMVSTQSKKLSFLVERVLQVSLFDKGDFQLKKIPLDVNESIKKVLAGFQLQIQDLDANVICKLDAVNPIIIADELHYTNVITNLFDNALKYRRGTPSIQIITSNKENGVLVSFSDNGIGISKEFQKRVFEQFFRVPSGNVHDIKGFGLGLSYVKKIIEIMEGEVWLQSDLNKGSTFYVWMPLKNKLDI